MLVREILQEVIGWLGGDVVIAFSERVIGMFIIHHLLLITAQRMLPADALFLRRTPALRALLIRTTVEQPNSLTANVWHIVS